MIIQHLRPAFVLLALFTALTGIVYPFAITGFAQAVLASRANGSIVYRDGNPVGSSLIGQNFAEARYFHARPSATSAPDPKDASKTVDAPYNAANSSGSNLGPLSQKLIDRVKTDLDAWHAAGFEGQPSMDSLTTSASGLDPDVSPKFAMAQSAAVAKARNLPESKVRDLVSSYTARAALGLYGEPRVNILGLNLALDRLGSS